MGRTKWAFAVSIAATVVVMGGLMGVADCVTCDRGPAAGFGAPACRGPIFGTEPGCCEHPPTPCDNAWAGFCQEKLKWKQFWYKVGSGHWVSPRTATPASHAAISIRQPLIRPSGLSRTRSDGIAPADTSDTIRYPPVEVMVQPAPKDPVRDRGPPPIPQPNDDFDLSEEPDEPAASQPGQARVSWEFSR